MTFVMENLYLAPGLARKDLGVGDFGDERLHPWQWPFVKVSGSRPGPRVCITAGMHAAEYPPMEALMHFAAGLDPTAVHGSLIILPAINVPGLYEHTYFTCPADGKDIHSSFPGDPEGTFSEILAYHIFEKAVRQADYYIDMHGGDLIEDLTPFAQYWHTNNHEVDTISREMAWHHVMPLVLGNYGKEVGPSNRGSAYAAASWLGIPSMMAEAGALGTLAEDAVDLQFRGLSNVLRFLKVLTGDSPRAKAREVRYNGRIRADREAFFVCLVQPGDTVRRDQIIGHYHDLFGKELAPIVALVDGMVLWRRSSPPVRPGANLLALVESDTAEQ